jgi:hypothetical protein
MTVHFGPCDSNSCSNKASSREDHGIFGVRSGQRTSLHRLDTWSSFLPGILNAGDCQRVLVPIHQAGKWMDDLPISFHLGPSSVYSFRSA